MLDTAPKEAVGATAQLAALACPPAEVASPTGPNPCWTIALNETWRVNGADGLQWTLEQRRKSGIWDGRKWHVERDCLLGSIRRECGDVDGCAIAAISEWPALYPFRKRSR